VDAFLSRWVSGGKEKVHVGPVFPGYVEGQAYEVTHEFGVMGKLAFLKRRAVHAT
jgi:hypothetical protein